MNANVIARKLDSLQQRAAMKSVDVANILQIRPETVSRWNQGKAFPQPDAERVLLDLEYVADLLGDLYQPQEARIWLLSRQRLLDGSVPAEMIRKGEVEPVLGVIKRLLDGVYI